MNSRAGKKLTLLLSNDDGVDAPGLLALAHEFRDHRVVVVAPERERSTTGHHLTLHKPLRLHKLRADVYSVSGGPADCIHIALNVVLNGRKPDLIISGINRGANLGQDVFYSGTASAAREGANQGIPAVGVSLSLDFHKKGTKENFETAAKSLRTVLSRTLPHFAGNSRATWKQGLARWPDGMFLNVNVPNVALGKIKGMAAAVQGYRIYSTDILQRVDSRARDYYWIGGTYKGYRNLKESDCWYVDHGYISVTPLELDTTMQTVYENLRSAWSIRS